MIDDYIGWPLRLFEETVPPRERQRYEIRYTVSRPEHMDDSGRTKRIIMAKDHVLYVACFRDGMPREMEKQE